MFKVSIPTPCHQDWGIMPASDRGRHCAACSKTVIDFTAMNDEELRNFFIHKKEGGICGRFKNEQIHHADIALPSNIFQLEMPWWKQFLVASLIVFGTTLFSCNTLVNENKNNENHTTQHSLKQADIMEKAGMIFRRDSIKNQGNTDCTTMLGKIENIYVDSTETITGVVLPAIFPMDTLTEDLNPQLIKSDTVHVQPANIISKPDSIQTENAGKKDSIECEGIPVIYS